MTTDLEDRLRRDLPRLADLIALDDEGERSTPTTTREHSHGRRRAVAAAVAASLAIGGIVATIALTRRGDHALDTPPPANRPVVTAGGTEPVADVPPSTNGPVTAAGGWRVLPPSPLGPRAHTVTVWTGTAALVWGGYRGDPTAPLALQSGAIYDPATNTWRSIADNSWAHPGAIGVWAGDRMVVMGKNGSAEYDPATDRWRDLPTLPDGAGGFLAATWSGTAVLAVTSGRAPGTITVATYDRAADVWKLGTPQLASFPSGTSQASVAWTGHELVVWDGVQTGWAYDPTTDGWRQLPVLTLPGADPLSSSIAWVSDTLVAAATNRSATAAGTGLSAARLVGDRWQVVAQARDVATEDPIAIDAGGTLTTLDRSGQGPPMPRRSVHRAMVHARWVPAPTRTGRRRRLDRGWSLRVGRAPQRHPGHLREPVPERERRRLVHAVSLAPTLVGKLASSQI